VVQPPRESAPKAANRFVVPKAFRVGTNSLERSSSVQDQLPKSTVPKAQGL